MRYFLAIILPPVAVLLCGKPVQFILNIILTLLFWIPGVIHALSSSIVTSPTNAQKKSSVP
jgi:uncharacterized membrane protein YqaE (UPF0057 family)